MTDPFSFITGLINNLIPAATATNPNAPNITFTPAQFQALLKAAETFGPLLMGISPDQMSVAEELLTAFGYGNLIPTRSPGQPKA